jgi:hypothetical protein
MMVRLVQKVFADNLQLHDLTGLTQFQAFTEHFSLHDMTTLLTLKAFYENFDLSEVFSAAKPSAGATVTLPLTDRIDFSTILKVKYAFAHASGYSAAKATEDQLGNNNRTSS